MPKRPPPGSIAEEGEDNLRQRIQFEREERGWSYEALARAMTEAGSPVSKAAIYAIENGNPPRRILVNELIALARVFEEADIQGMLRPLESVLSDRARRLMVEAREAEAALTRGVEGVVSTAAAYLALRQVGGELAEFEVNQLSALGWPPVPMVNASWDRGEQGDAAEELSAAYVGLWGAALGYANEVANRG